MGLPRPEPGDAPSPRLTEITRSFSFKLNVGNYESRDFFCSRKMEVPEEKAAEYSEELHRFCMDEVRRDVIAFKKSQARAAMRTNG